MPAFRVDRLLASTAVVLLLSASAGLAAPPADPASPPTPATNAAAAPASGMQGAQQQSQKDVTPAPAANPASADTSGAEGKSAPAAAANSNAAGNAPAAAATAPTAAAQSDHSTPAASPAANAAATPANPPAPAAATASDTKSAPAEAASPSGAAPAAATAASPATSAPAIAAAPAGPDTAIADQLREVIDGKLEHMIGNKKEREQIAAFYASRNDKPLWIADSKANANAKAAIGYLAHVDTDGLFPSDYPVPDFASLTAPADLANAELQLTVTVLTYVHHASMGRVAWSRVSPDIEYDRSAPEPSDVLAKIADATDMAAALDSYEPHTPGYLALKAKLTALRAGNTGSTRPAIAEGPVLKVGMQDARVPELRKRLGVNGDGDGDAYDKTLAEAVKKFQREHRLAATGTLTAATVEAIDGPKPAHLEDTILANMERWRWMPHEFPASYVIVNLPDYTLRVMHDGQQLWKTDIVVGKPDMPTPIMTKDMKFITINPTWNVPPSIVNREYLPALQQDPTVLERMGLKVGRNPDGSVHIWQPPGDKNALGRIRFNFPNKFLVYQHDTPDKYLFKEAKRAFSHGCMRVEDPVHYAEVLLSLTRPGDDYTEERIRKMFGPNEVNIDFPTFIPVNLTYQTAFVDSAGKLETRDDIYGRDRALIAILKGDRKDADIPVEHREDISHREVLAMPDEPSLFGGGRGFFGSGTSYYPNNNGRYPARAYGGGENFFSRLFGGFNNAPPAPIPPRHRTAASHSKRASRAVEER